MLLLLSLVACPAPSTDTGDTASSSGEGLPEGVEARFTCAGTADDFDADAPAFTEATDAWGLTPFTGGTMIAFDADGDGWPDLLTHEASAEGRDDPEAGVYLHRLFLNRESGGRRVFVDATDDSGLLVGADGAPGSGHGVYVAGDVDQDGDLDLFAGRYHDAGGDDVTGERNAIFLNDGAAHFTRLADSGVATDAAMPTVSASFTEVDGDGILDLWVVNWYDDYGGGYDSGPPRLYRGRGDGRFDDVTAGTAMDLKATRTSEHWNDRTRRRPGYGATACDVNADGGPELIQSSYARTWNLMFGQRAGEWVEVGEGSGMDADDNLDYSDNLYYVCWCEVTGDCDDPEPAYACPDTAYASWTPGYDDQPARLAGNTFTTVCGDVDNDGDLDLYNAEIHHEWAGVSADESQLLINDGSGQFTRLDNDDGGLLRKAGNNHSDMGDLQAGFFDLDNDGWKDVILVESDYPDTQMWVWRNLGDGWDEVSRDAGLNQDWPHGLAIADFDLDGDVDVVTGSSHARSGSPWEVNTLHLYENRLGGSSLRLTGLAIGTRVLVRSEGLEQTFEVGGGYGVGGMQHDLALTIGLDGACAVEDLVITPPHGEAHSTGPLAADAE